MKSGWKLAKVGNGLIARPEKQLRKERADELTANLKELVLGVGSKAKEWIIGLSIFALFVFFALGVVECVLYFSFF